MSLTVNAEDQNGLPLKHTPLIVLDKNGGTAFSGNTDNTGVVELELLEYSVEGSEKTFSSPYTIIVGKTKKQVALDQNSAVKIHARR